MTKQHTITPPPELVRKWDKEAVGTHFPPYGYSQFIATRAAQWGSDQELEACLEWLDKNLPGYDACEGSLRAARRPKPPSAKEQALFALAVLTSADETCSIAEIQQHWHTIRRALEQLDD